MWAVVLDEFVRTVGPRRVGRHADLRSDPEAVDRGPGCQEPIDLELVEPSACEHLDPLPDRNLDRDLAEAEAAIARLGLGVEDLFHHALAVLHDPAYREANAGALRMEWPRIPLPSWPDGDTPEAADDLRTSAARGRELATLLDPETPAPGVTSGTLRPELATIAVPSTAGGHNIADDDFALTAGWGHFGTGDAVMPGTGYSVARDYTAPEREALGDAADALGDSTLDIHLNGNARWSDVPASVWNYKLGGYQVLKKWLSYREHKVLGRNMHPDEVRHFTDTARRIAAILMLTARP